MQKLQLKNIKFSEWNSQETNCFEAVVYFEGKRVAYAHNDGRGGCTWASPIGDDVEGFKAMREYCEEYKNANGHYDTFSLIDIVFEDYLEAQFKKKQEAKMRREFSKGLVYSKGDPNTYNIMTFKAGGKSVTIEDMLKSASGRIHLNTNIYNLKESGYKILNTNLPMAV